MVAQPVYTSDPVEAYLLHLRGLGRAEGTLRQYRITLTVAVRHLDGRGLLEAGPIQWKRVLSMSPWGAGLGPSTKRSQGGRLVSFLEWAATEELVPAGTAEPLREYVSRIKPPKKRLPTALSMLEVEELERRMWERNRQPARDIAVLWVMAGAGGRITETLQLHLDDLDFKAGEIRFWHDTKGGTDRTVPMLPVVRRALRDWLKVRVSPTRQVFPSQYARAMRSIRSYGHMLDLVARQDPSLQWPICILHGERSCDPGRGPGQCSRARMRVHPHTLRHTFATEARRSGALSLAALRDILGHANIATTDIYDNEDVDVERFKRRFGKGRG
jgi:site-specific recombinase XerD